MWMHSSTKTEETLLCGPDAHDPAESLCLAYLVRFLPVAESLPHGHAVTPHVTLAGKFVVKDTFWCIPFQRPLSSCPGLQQSDKERRGPLTLGQLDKH